MTDSTADIPSPLAEQRDLRVVPMTVTFGDESFISGVTLPSDRFYERLRGEPTIPTTSMPNPAWFEEAYADAADDGYHAVVSVHLSSALSGTCDLARKVAADAPLPVTVVDSRQAGGALALAVLAALRAAEAGAAAEHVAAVAHATAGDARVYFAVDNLDYLRRGGRLSGSQALIGNVLKVRPILTLTDGRVEPLERVRTWSRAVERLAELASAHAGGAAIDLVVMHGAAPQRARVLRAALQADVREDLETVIGPVLGAHLGPGAAGVAVAHRHG